MTETNNHKNWSLRDLLRAERDIWGPERLDIEQVVVRLGVNFGKLARLARGATKDVDPKTYMLEMKLAMGHIIASMVRWCDDLGLDPSDCVNEALQAQQKFATENPER